MTTKIGLYKRFGVPDAVVTLIFLVVLIVLLEPYFGGTDWGRFKLPDLPGSGYLMVIAPVLLLLWCLGLWPFFEGEETPEPVVVATPDAYGLSVERIAWINRYAENGDFEGAVEYNVTCTSDKPIYDLLPDYAIGTPTTSLGARPPPSSWATRAAGRSRSPRQPERRKPPGTSISTRW